MATEAEYDEIIAPMLKAVADRCQELGMSLIAQVEWQPGETGITQINIGPATGIGQKMAWLAAHAHGNVDKFCIAMLNRFDCSQSVVLLQSRTCLRYND